jgi:uncharacterized protein (DUF3820 family)
VELTFLQPVAASDDPLQRFALNKAEDRLEEYAAMLQKVPLLEADDTSEDDDRETNCNGSAKDGPSPQLAEVQWLYGKYNPEKLADVPALAAKYGAEKLLVMVRKKYKEQEAAGADPVATWVVPSSTALAEINRMYGKYNPEKLADVPALAAKYGVEKLLVMMRKKYSQQEQAATSPEPTGKAAAKELQNHIAQHGTKDVGKINRLRRASLAPDQPAAAVMMAAAPDTAGPLAEVERLYGKYNPEKLADVPALAAKYGAQKLLAMVRKKYSQQEWPGSSPQLAEVQWLYGKYNPEKLADVPALAAKYGEEKLLVMVRKKYSGQEGKQAPQGADLAERSQTPPGRHSSQAQVTVGKRT